MKTALLATLALCAAARSASATTCDVTAYGASGTDQNDDRAAIQAAIAACSNSGDQVFIPAGQYLVSRDGNTYAGLVVPGGVTLRGAGPLTVLRQTANIAASVRLIRATGVDARIEDMTLDGNRSNQATASEHRHGIFADGTTGLRVSRVTAQNFTGDGYCVYTGSTYAVFDQVRATGNARNGLTFGGGVTSDLTVTNSTFDGNAVQQIDSEGTATNDVLITGCRLDGAGSNDFALTISGSSSSTRSRDWVVTGNEINGGIFVVWSEHVQIVNNHGVNPTTKPSADVYRTSSDIEVSGNVFTMTQTTIDYLGVVRITGTGAGSVPVGVAVTGNVLRAAHGDGWTVRVTGAREISILDNVLSGLVYLRTTVPGEDLSATVRHNVLTAATIGTPSGTAQNGTIVISDNVVRVP